MREQYYHTGTTLNILGKNKNPFIHCKSGARSALALEIMWEAGSREGYNMLGRIVKWKAEGLETVEG